MKCRACGRPAKGPGSTGRFIIARWGNVLEPLCWTCTYWARMGKVYDRR